MTRIRVMPWICTLPPNKVHNLVFTFSRNASVRDDDLHLLKKMVSMLEWLNYQITDLFPAGVRIHLLGYPIPQGRSQQSHEWCSWCDSIGVPGFLILLIFADFFAHGYK